MKEPVIPHPQEQKQYTILDLPKILSNARELSILGYYETSLSKYQIALTIVQDRYKEITEEFIKPKWKMTELNLKSEIAQTKQILELCKTLKNEYFDYKKKQVDTDDISQRKLKDENILVFDMSSGKKQKAQPNISHFGGVKPFQNGNTTIYDPFNPFIGDRINGIGRGVNDNIVPEKDEILNNINFNRKLSGKQIKNKDKSPFKKNPNVKRIPNSANSMKDRQNFDDNSSNSSFINPLEAFGINTSNLGNTSMNTTIMTTVGGGNGNNINNTTFINEIHNYMAINNININTNSGGNDNNKNFKKRWSNYSGSVEKKKNAWNNNNSNNYQQKPIIQSKNMSSNNVGRTKTYSTKNSAKNLPKPQYGMAKLNDALDKMKPSDKMRKKYGGLLDREGKDNSKTTSTKSKFLLDRYPDTKGIGPDTDLIEMLEQEVVETNPNVQLEDRADLESAKNTLQETVFLPLLIPNFFKGIRRAWRGVLLYGPPGTGKTLLAKAIATKGKTTFFNVHSSSFASKWRGESEKLVRLLFEMARFYAPTTIFIDEIDSLCSKRGDSEGESSRKVKSEFLVQMDGVSTNDNKADNTNGDKDSNEGGKAKIVTVMAATNRPWDLDEAIRRRFEKRIYIPLPNEKGRKELFKINLKNIKLSNDINFDELVKKSEGYSGHDISNVCREAAFMPMRKKLAMGANHKIEELVQNPEFQKNIDAGVSMQDLLQALTNISKSVGKKDIEVFEKWTNEFKSV